MDVFLPMSPRWPFDPFSPIIATNNRIDKKLI